MSTSPMEIQRHLNPHASAASLSLQRKPLQPASSGSGHSTPHETQLLQLDLGRRLFHCASGEQLKNLYSSAFEEVRERTLLLNRNRQNIDQISYDKQMD
ncbi:MAG: hypothetical protein V4448_13210 [Pseudomonadota bacterium]